MDISSIENLATSQPAVAEPAIPHPDAQQRRELIGAIKAVNAAAFFGQDHELTFVMDRRSHQAVVRIVNRETREVIQQFPDEYVLRLAEELKVR